MANYSKYNLDPSQFHFLNTFRDNWQNIRDEFTYFSSCASEDELIFTRDALGPKSKTLRTKQRGKYSAFGILFQGLFVENYILKYRIQYPKLECNQASQMAFNLRKKYFPKLSQVIANANSANDDIVRNVYFGTYYPGLDIKLHVNDHPHMNRGYLGLIVPEGDVAMKICHDKLYWQEGKFMVLDHSYPHCPHNYTDRDRTVLIVDFFKPEMPREQAIAFETQLVTKRMQDNPYCLGVFGKSDKAKQEDFVKYGLAHQLEWDKALQT